MPRLIYLSDAKLRQFETGERRPFAWLRSLSVEIKALVGFKLSVELSERRRRLRRAERRLRKEVVPWTRAELRPGTWVSFERALSCVETTAEGHDLVLFVDEVGAGRRLLLHGSRAHLLGLPDGGHTRQVDLVAQDSGAQGISEVARAQQHAPRSSRWPFSRSATPTVHEAVVDMLAAIEKDRRGVDDAVPTRGLAIVTMTFEPPHDDLVVASPLVVRHAPGRTR